MLVSGFLIGITAGLCGLAVLLTTVRRQRNRVLWGCTQRLTTVSNTGTGFSVWILDQKGGDAKKDAMVGCRT